jgi:hypothetical protein
MKKIEQEAGHLFLVSCICFSSTHQDLGAPVIAERSAAKSKDLQLFFHYQDLGAPFSRFFLARGWNRIIFIHPLVILSETNKAVRTPSASF